MKIYIVEVGSYSDTRVVAAFSEKEPADRLADLINGNVLEPLELDAGVDCERPPRRFYWSVEMKHDGAIVGAYSSAPLGDGVYSNTDIGKAKPTGYHIQSTSRKWRLHVYCYADDKETAIKITNDLRAQILAGVKLTGGNYGNLLPI